MFLSYNGIRWYFCSQRTVTNPFHICKSRQSPISSNNLNEIFHSLFLYKKQLIIQLLRQNAELRRRHRYCYLIITLWRWALQYHLRSASTQTPSRPPSSYSNDDGDATTRGYNNIPWIKYTFFYIKKLPECYYLLYDYRYGHKWWFTFNTFPVFTFKITRPTGAM